MTGDLTPRPLANDAAADARARTVVSIEFDHAFTDQLPAVELANQLGMKVTLFAMSGRLGLSGYLSAGQLRTLQAAGNEIGGHTIDHQDLSQLPAATQVQAVCDDRVALQAQGLEVTDFAYPYGHFDRATPGIVRRCGYQSARGVGGVAQPSCRGQCAGVPAETIPPADPFDTRTADSVLDTTSLATIEGYVTHAERAGGGWVQIIFHYVCDRCDPYAVTVQTFSRFATWLARRAAHGTREQTVREVINTPFEPAPTWLAATPGQRLQVAQACPSTPVGASCRTWPQARVSTAVIRPGSQLLIRTTASAQFVTLALPGRRPRAAAPSGRTSEGTDRQWRISVRRSSRVRSGTLSVRYALGVASYHLRILAARAEKPSDGFS